MNDMVVTGVLIIGALLGAAMTQEKIAVIGIIIGALIGAAIALEKTRGARHKQYIAEGRQHGRATAESIGVEKAYRIAETLPDCPYRDGYTQGVAEVEDEAK